MTAPKRPKARRLGFLATAAVVLGVVSVGEVVGRLAAGLPGRIAAGAPVAKDWLLLAFLFCSGGWAFLSREAIVRFLRSMHTAVVLVALTLMAVAIGVLVPQIDGFEDPEQRVTAENYDDQYDAFRWAEGYFLYHLMHLYGIGMPEAEIPAPALASLDRFGERYGLEERDNRLKRMRAAFTGQAKTREIREFIEGHDAALRRAFDVATALDLNRTYKSSWFFTLLALLGTGIFMNTFTGPPKSWFRLQRVGFFVTHCGMMTLLVGGAISKFNTARGIMHLDLRQPPTDRFDLFFDRHKPARLPFHVGLERFARKEWKQVMVEFPEEGFSTRPPTYTLWPGREIDLDYREGEDGEMRPGVRLRVASLYDRARVETRLSEVPEGGDAEGLVVGPLAELTVRTPDPHGGEALEQVVRRVPGLDRYRTLSDPLWRFRLGTSFDREGPGERAAAFPPDDGRLGVLWVRDQVGADATDRPLPIRLGETVEAPGGYRVEIREAIPNYVVDESTGTVVRDGRPLAEQRPDNPAVVCWITPDDGGEPERRVVRENLDAVSAGLQAGYEYSELVLFLEWDEWVAPGPPRYLLHWGSEDGPLLVGEEGEVTPVHLGEPLALESETRVVPRALYERASFDHEVRFEPSAPADPGQVDPDFYSHDPRGLALDVVHDPGTADERVERVDMVTDGLAATWTAADGHLRLTFFENTAMMPFEWRSVLSIHERGPDGELQRVDTGSERASEIRVNDYFYWKGYRFFQTNADPDFPTYSGIGVVYDPGIPVVLAGMYTIIAGTVLAFIVRPIVRARRRKERAA